MFDSSNRKCAVQCSKHRLHYLAYQSLIKLQDMWTKWVFLWGKRERPKFCCWFIEFSHFPDISSRNEFSSILQRDVTILQVSI